MKFWNEFKDFALKGNMVDLAIGIIIGAAFSNVVNSLVSDIIMPPVGLLIGGMDFSQFSLDMHLPGSPLPPVEWKYGQFLSRVLDLLIISGTIFVIIKIMTSLKREQKIEEAPSIERCPECKMEIPKEARKCGHCCSSLRESEHERIW